MADEAVEVDRRRRARVGLEVGDLGHRGNVGGELGQHRRGALDRRARGHVDDHLELALVVERQHLQHHELHDRERDGREDRHHRRHTEEDATTPAALLGDERDSRR